MFSFLKSTHVFKQEFSSRLEQTDLTFKLTHITFNYGACSLHLDLEQLKGRTIKSSTMFQVLCSTIILKFFASCQNKIQRFHCMTLSNLSKYVVFVDHHNAIAMLCLSFPTSKAYVEFIGREKARAYLQCIYCKVKQ